MTASRITMRRTPKGVSIRATGSAAQALCDAITHGAESAKADPALVAARVLPLQILVVGRNNTYEAHALPGAASTSAGLKGVRATCTAGRRQALDALLAKADAETATQTLFKRVQSGGHWPHDATVKLAWAGPGHSDKPGWAKRNEQGQLVSVYSGFVLDAEMWRVVEERT